MSDKKGELRARAVAHLVELLRRNGELVNIDGLWVWTCRHCGRKMAGSAREVINNGVKHVAARHGSAMSN